MKKLFIVCMYMSVWHVYAPSVKATISGPKPKSPVKSGAAPRKLPVTPPSVKPPANSGVTPPASPGATLRKVSVTPSATSPAMVSRAASVTSSVNSGATLRQLPVTSSATPTPMVSRAASVKPPVSPEATLRTLPVTPTSPASPGGVTMHRALPQPPTHTIASGNTVTPTPMVSTAVSKVNLIEPTVTSGATVNTAVSKVNLAVPESSKIGKIGTLLKTKLNEVNTNLKKALISDSMAKDELGVARYQRDYGPETVKLRDAVRENPSVLKTEKAKIAEQVSLSELLKLTAKNIGRAVQNRSLEVEIPTKERIEARRRVKAVNKALANPLHGAKKNRPRSK